MLSNTIVSGFSEVSGISGGINKMFNDAMYFPMTAFMNFVVSDSDKRMIYVKMNKDKVLEYIRCKKTASLIEISNEFNLDLNTTASILNQLELEQLINFNQS
jgi:predicted transcriptional regulator